MNMLPRRIDIVGQHFYWHILLGDLIQSNWITPYYAAITLPIFRNYFLTIIWACRRVPALRAEYAPSGCFGFADAHSYVSRDKSRLYLLLPSAARRIPHAKTDSPMPKA